jgi:hypothetical protein
MPFIVIYAMCSCIGLVMDAMCSCIGLVMDAMFWHSASVAHVIMSAPYRVKLQ